MNEQEALEHLMNWGQQTISCAISVRALESGKTLDTEESAKFAAAEAYNRTDDLWVATNKKLGPNPPNRLLNDHLYARRVRLVQRPH
jgi:hypothetical protein